MQAQSPDVPQLGRVAPLLFSLLQAGSTQRGQAMPCPQPRWRSTPRARISAQREGFAA